MAKYCKKCGAMLDETSGKCPSCDKNTTVEMAEEIKDELSTATEHQDQLSKKELKAEKKKLKKQAKKDKKAQKKAQLTKKQKVKRFFLKFFAVILALTIAAGGCLVALIYFGVVDISHLKKTPQEIYATKIIDAFRDDDMSAIRDIIFNQNLCVVDDNIGVTFDDSVNNNYSDKGVLKAIFLETQLSLIKVEGNAFIYEVEAPEMAGIFNDTSNIQTEEELLSHIEQFIKAANKKKTKVSVDFSEIEGRYTANYSSEAFINAITGGLVDEYKNILSQYMDELVSKEW